MRWVFLFWLGTIAPGVSAVQWVGDSYHFPSDGEVKAGQDIWINTSTRPIGGATQVRVVYSTNGLDFTSVPLAKHATQGDRDLWHVNLGGFAMGTRIDYAIHAEDNAGGSLWDSRNGVNHPIHVLSIIHDVYKDKAKYQPGDPTLLIIELTNTLSSVISGVLDVRVRHLVDDVASFSVPVHLSPGQAEVVDIPWTTPILDFRGYGIDVDLLVDGEVIDRRSHAMDVSSDWRRYPRYGFYSDYWPGKSDEEIERRAKLLSKHHINVIQYYDWAYSHDYMIHRDPEGVPIPYYRNFIGRTLSLDVVKKSIEASRNLNMLSMSYSLMYGDSIHDGCATRLDWAAFNGPWQTACHDVASHPPDGDWIFVMDVSNDDWRNHMYGQYREIVRDVGFDGVHLDNLGGSTRYRYNSDHVIDEKYWFPQFINLTYSAVRDERPNTWVTYNDVAGNYFWEIAQSSADVYYQEVWGRETYWDLRDIVLNAKSLSGGSKQPVLAAYMHKFDPPPDFISEAGVRLANASIFANGGFHLELGEGDQMLVNEYFPIHHPPMHWTLKRAMRDYYDVLVRYQNLFAFNNLGNVYDGTDGANIWSGTHALNKWGGVGGIWTVVKVWPGEFDKVSLINLHGVDDQWRNRADRPPVQIDILLKYYVDAKVYGVYIATPDDGLGRPMPLEYSEGVDEIGYYVMLTVPRLDYWNILLFDKRGRIKTDGWPGDWIGTSPEQMHEVAVSEGEWIYRGAANDHRTWGGASANQDLTEVRVTSDEHYVYFLIGMQGITDPGLPAVGIAWDTDQDSGDSSHAWIGDASTPGGSISLADPIQYAERQIMFYWAEGAPHIRLWDGGIWYQPPSGDSLIHVSATHNIIEARINKHDLNIPSYPQKVSMSLATFRSGDRHAGNNATYDNPDNNNDAVDVMGGNPGVMENAWARDLNDNTISFFHQFTLNAFGVERRVMNGRMTDWIGSPSDTPQSSTVSAGELIVTDRIGDVRDPGQASFDLAEFRLIGDKDPDGNLYLLARLADFVPQDSDPSRSPLIQVALETAPGGAGTSFATTGQATEDVGLPVGFAWNHLVRISGAGKTAWVDDGMETHEVSSALVRYGESELENLVEVRIPYSLLGGADRFLGQTIRTAVLVSRDNPSQPGSPAVDHPGTPYARDGIGIRDGAALFYDAELLAADGHIRYAFVVRFDETGSAVNTPPTVPASLQPADGGILFRDDPSLSWLASTDADAGDDVVEYRIEVTTTNNALLWAKNTGSNDVSATIPLEVDLSVYDEILWRLAARDRVGVLSFSPWLHLTLSDVATSSPPAAINLMVDGQPGGPAESYQPELSWTFTDTDPESGQSAFRIQIATEDAFNDIVWDSGDVQDSQPNVLLSLPHILMGATQFHWRIKLWDEGGTEGAWSASQLFAVRIRVIDGNPGDWSSLPVIHSNQAWLANGEWRWVDRVADVRTESPDHQSNDLTELRITSDEDFLYVLAHFRNIGVPPHPPVSMLSLAVDTSRDGEGMDWIGDESNTLLSSWSTNRIRADRVLDLSWDGVFVYDPDLDSWVEPGSAEIIISTVHNSMEARIPLDALGITPATGFTIRVAAATFQRQGGNPNDDDHTAPFFMTDALDILHPSFANSWEADLDNSRIEFFVDIPLSSAGAISRTIPDSPALLAPDVGETITNLVPTLWWAPLDVGPNESPPWYHVQVSTSENFTNRLYKMDTLVIADDGAVGGEPVSFVAPYPLIHGQSYVWRVRTLDGHGQASPWSSPRSFTILGTGKVVDGHPGDWVGQPPSEIHTTTLDHGEWIYRGALWDGRFWGDGAANVDQDLTEVRVTSDDTYVYFLLRFHNLRFPNATAVGIAWDVDQDPEDTSYDWIGDASKTGGGSIALADPVQYAERQLMFHWSGGPKIRLWNGSEWAIPASGDHQIVINDATDAIEARINKNDLAVSYPQRINMSLVTFVNSGMPAGQNSTFDSNFVNDGVDVMGGQPGVWADSWSRDLHDSAISYHYGFTLTENGVLPDVRFEDAPYQMDWEETTYIGIRLHGSAKGPVSVVYRTEDVTAVAGTDYLTATGMLNWAAGESGVRWIALTSLTNLAESSNEIFRIVLEQPVNATIEGGAEASADVTISPVSLSFIGHIYAMPLAGQITFTDSIWINGDTWPPNAAREVFVQYRVNGGSWTTLPMAPCSNCGTDPNNDRWHRNIGAFPAGSQVEYLLLALDHVSVLTRNDNDGSYYLAIVNGVLGDSDGDGIPDWWEQQYFGGPTMASASLDTDGDGFTNYEEYIAGTHPHNPFSYPWIYQTGMHPDDNALLFPTSTGRVYSIQILESSNFQEGWQGLPEHMNLWGTGGLQVRSDTNPVTGMRIYRVLIEKP